MKDLKMFGLAAVAAAALMAFAGAGTASADELCTTAAVNNMCPEEKLIEKLEMSLTGSAKLTNTKGDLLVTCTSGTWKMTNITPANGNTTGSATVLSDTPPEDTTWGSAGTPCTFETITIKGGVNDLTPAAGGGTTVTATSTQVTINTVLFGSCVYGVGSGIDFGTVAQGGSTLAVNTGVTKISGFACPETTAWDATYKVTNHNAWFYINN